MALVFDVRRLMLKDKNTKNSEAFNKLLDSTFNHIYHKGRIEHELSDDQNNQLWLLKVSKNGQDHELILHCCGKLTTYLNTISLNHLANSIAITKSQWNVLDPLFMGWKSTGVYLCPSLSSAMAPTQITIMPLIPGIRFSLTIVHIITVKSFWFNTILSFFLMKSLYHSTHTFIYTQKNRVCRIRWLEYIILLTIIFYGIGYWLLVCLFYLKRDMNETLTVLYGLSLSYLWTKHASHLFNKTIFIKLECK